MNAAGLVAVWGRISDAPDAVGRLRRFVLDLATRGKLVPQDASEEPAIQLATRILAARSQLANSGKIRAPKRLPSIDNVPFNLPSNWLWTRVRDVTSDRGQTEPHGEFTYIDVTSIDSDKGVILDPTILSKTEAPSRARKVIRRGDVLYSCVRPYLLNVAVVEHDFNPPAIASTAFAVLDGYNLVAPKYIWLTLRSPLILKCVEGTQRGQAYPAINDADFALLPFPLPPLAEQ